MPATSKEVEPRENPRTAKSQEKLVVACELIAEQLKAGEWVSSKQIHQRLAKKVSEGMFGRAKSTLDVQHRRVSEGGKPQYQWRGDPKVMAAKIQEMKG
jgi:hypothetical protein